MLRDLLQRVERIEQNSATGPLSQAETAELERLEAEWTRYSDGIDTRSSAELDDTIAYHCGRIGDVGRLRTLRWRSGYFLGQGEP